VNLLNYMVAEDATIREALIKIDSNELGTVFVVDGGKRVIGVATDGDIRTRILLDASLSAPIGLALNKDFVWRYDTDNRESVLKLLDSKIKVIPILDSEGALVDIVTPSNFPIVFEKRVFSQSIAPVRISFAGGGSDLTHYFMSDVGSVLNATISLYAHATLRPRDDRKVTISSLDLKDTIEASDLETFLACSDKFDLFRGLLQLIKPNFGFDLYVRCDFPQGSGLGGSSAVLAAILGCFNEFRSDKWNEYELAELAFQSERIILDISGGWQDQYATIFGGINFIEFKNGDNLIHPLRLAEKTILNLEESLVLYELNTGRNSGAIHDDQKKVMQSQEIKKKVEINVKHCLEMRESLLRGNLDTFGKGLNIAWELKRQFSSKISSTVIDEIYDYAIENGALGGKLLGAGGGGFFLFYIKDFEKNHFMEAMRKKGLIETRFKFDLAGIRSWKKRDELKLISKGENSENW